MSLVDIEYHKPCTYYDDGYHRKRSGWYSCECGASSAWHETKPVEPDYEAAAESLWTWPAGQSEPSPAMKARYTKDARRAVDAALGIGGDDE